jgi:menaquinone-dependent protoporphyrinogen oxidase
MNLGGLSMPPSILVTYASKYGATQEIADQIGRTLQEAGLEVVIAPANQADNPESFDAVILGSAVYAGMWRKQAIQFLEQHEKTLASKPTWLFSSGPTDEGDPVELLDGWTFPEAQQPIADRLQPREITVFHGALDPSKLNFAERLVIKGIKAPTGDFRDWDAIRNWAKGIAAELQN